MNVQPHSGSQANAAVYQALVKPGETMLGMSLDHGGHLTHGAKVNFSGKLYNAVQYGIRPDNGEIDYDEVRRLAELHRPKMIVAGFSAYSRVIDWQRFGEIAKSVGAYMFVDMAHVAGLIAMGCYPNPIPHADVVTTTTHKTLRGPRGGLDPRARQRRGDEEAQFHGVPRHSGRPAHACDRREGRRVQGSPAAGIQGIPASDARELARDGRALQAARLHHRVERHGQPPVPAEPRRSQHHRQGCGRRPRAAPTSP